MIACCLKNYLYYHLIVSNRQANYLTFRFHVLGMIGLQNKTKGLYFCNNSIGYIELYNDPEVSKLEYYYH